MNKFLILFSLFFLTKNYAQKYELGKVTIDELNEKVCPIDTSAVAAYIFKDQITTYLASGQVMDIIRVKLKIYKKEGYHYGNVEDVFPRADKDKGFFEVVTYNLVNGEIVKSKLGKDGEFSENVGESAVIKKIALPDVKEGSIIEYKIVNVGGGFYRPVNFYFQEEIPIKRIILTVDHPARFEYNKSLTGSLSPGMKSETITDHVNVRRLKNRLTYELLDVPPLKDEGYVNNINNYRSRLQYELASVENNIGYRENIAADWPTITKKIYDSEDFGGELSKKDYFEKELDLLLVDQKTRDEKINKVLKFVKSKVKWNNTNGVTCEKGVRKAYKEKTGNAADINLMLTAMLNYADVPAVPVLITTRSKLINPFPSLTSNNYVIAGVETTDGIITLDATSQYTKQNILPLRCLNQFGRTVKKDGSTEEIDIMPKKKSEEVINLIGTMNADGEINGKIRNKYTEYNAFLYREKFNNLSKETNIETLEKKYEGVEILDLEIKNSQDLEQPVIEEYAFKSTKGVEAIGDKIYFSPMMFFAKTKNPFKQEKREYPVDFAYPNQDKYNISIVIPEGYSVETFPQSKAFAMPDNLAGFSYNISVVENKIQLQCVVDINQAVIGSEYYETLKNFYKEIVAAQTEKIVLKKG